MTMGQLGTKLKQARLEQGLSLEQLNERTKIQKHHLEGIETGDYSAIPGGFYVRAFIKRYAQAVGLDGDSLLMEHKNELPEDAPEAVPAEHLTRRPEKKKRSSGPVAESMPKVLVALFIVFILLVIWYFYLLSTSGNDVQQEEEGGGDVEYEAPAEQPEQQPEAAEEQAPPADEPEEQPEPPPDLGPSPVAVGRPQGVALAVFIACRIIGDHVQHQRARDPEEADGCVGLEALRVSLLRAPCGCAQFAQLLDHTAVEQQCPAVPLHQSSTSPSMSSFRFTM